MTTLEMKKNRTQVTQNSVDLRKHLWSKSNESKLRVETSMNHVDISSSRGEKKILGFTNRMEQYKLMAQIGQGSYA